MGARGSRQAVVRQICFEAASTMHRPALPPCRCASPRGDADADTCMHACMHAGTVFTAPQRQALGWGWGGGQGSGGWGWGWGWGGGARAGARHSPAQQACAYCNGRGRLQRLHRRMRMRICGGVAGSALHAADASDRLVHSFMHCSWLAGCCENRHFASVGLQRQQGARWHSLTVPAWPCPPWQGAEPSRCNAATGWYL